MKNKKKAVSGAELRVYPTKPHYRWFVILVCGCDGEVRASGTSFYGAKRFKAPRSACCPGYCLPEVAK